jgi:hypothetical protein
VSLAGQQGKASGVDFVLKFAPGALALPTAITVTETTIPPPVGFIDYSPVYRIDPPGLTFAGRVGIVVPSGNTDGSVGQGLSIEFSLDGSSAFSRIGDSYVNAGFLQGTLPSTGFVFAGYPAPPQTCR